MTILVLSTEKPTTLSVLPVVRAVETKLMQAPAAPQMGANRQKLPQEKNQCGLPSPLKYLIQKAHSKNLNTG
ncbi:hypothetical protein OH710_15965 [Pseudomonas capsici]|uniref:hypothetical protein n=1 Tax=Pseudomonas capsici TaxID=2810614 RepID=UPI0021F1ADF7|nr:hypothetical protein [Pseudomonas capsici]MCV4274139.1 hypothetical protein [Pseudomonas capsici]